MAELVLILITHYARDRRAYAKLDNKYDYRTPRDIKMLLLISSRMQSSTLKLPIVIKQIGRNIAWRLILRKHTLCTKLDNLCRPLLIMRMNNEYVRNSYILNKDSVLFK